MWEKGMFFLSLVAYSFAIAITTAYIAIIVINGYNALGFPLWQTVIVSRLIPHQYLILYGIAYILEPLAGQVCFREVYMLFVFSGKAPHSIAKPKEQ